MHSNELKKLFLSIKDEKTLFVGLGNYQRGDDAVGLYVIERLKSKCKKKNFTFLIAETTPENYFNTLTSKELDLIIFFDACRFSNNAGEIKILRPEEISTFATSTHTSSISVIISYIRKFSKVKVEVIGINILSADLIPEISPELKESADSLITMIKDATS